MSQEDVEIARAAFGALAEGDFESFFSALDEDVEWVNPPYAVESGTRQGTGEFRAAFGRIGASFRGIRDGKVVRYEWFRDKAEALEAGGAS